MPACRQNFLLSALTLMAALAQPIVPRETYYLPTVVYFFFIGPLPSQRYYRSGSRRTVEKNRSTIDWQSDGYDCGRVIGTGERCVDGTSLGLASFSRGKIGGLVVCL